MIIKKDNIILDNGCIVKIDFSIFHPIITLVNGDVYELQFKCKNSSCINEAHVAYKLTYDKGIKITDAEKYTPKNIQGCCGHSIMESKKKEKQTAYRERKTYLDKLKADKELLWAEYLKIQSLRDLAIKYEVSTGFLRRYLFKDKDLTKFRGRHKDNNFGNSGVGSKPC